MDHPAKQLFGDQILVSTVVYLGTLILMKWNGRKVLMGQHSIPLNHWTDNSSVRSEDPSSQSLLLENVTLDHQQYYQVSVSNVFGTRTSNSVFLQVTGSM